MKKVSSPNLIAERIERYYRRPLPNRIVYNLNRYLCFYLFLPTAFTLFSYYSFVGRR